MTVWDWAVAVALVALASLMGAIVFWEEEPFVLSLRTLFHGTPHAVLGTVGEDDCPTAVVSEAGDRNDCLIGIVGPQLEDVPPTGESAILAFAEPDAVSSRPRSIWVALDAEWRHRTRLDIKIDQSVPRVPNSLTEVPTRGRRVALASLPVGRGASLQPDVRMLRASIGWATEGQVPLSGRIALLVTPQTVSDSDSRERLESELGGKLGSGWLVDAVSIIEFVEFESAGLAEYSVIILDTGFELVGNTTLESGAMESEKSLILEAGRIPVVSLSMRLISAIGIPDNARSVLNLPIQENGSLTLQATEQGLGHPAVRGLLGDIPAASDDSLSKTRPYLLGIAAIALAVAVAISFALQEHDTAIGQLTETKRLKNDEAEDFQLPYVLRITLDYERERFTTWNAAFQWVSLTVVVSALITVSLQLFLLMTSEHHTAGPGPLDIGLVAAGLTWIWVALLFMLIGRWVFSRKHLKRFARIYKDKSDDLGEDAEGKKGTGASGSEARGGRADGIGICLSGGGIRSAAFSLGALQAFQENQIWEDVTYLSAVSGGAYTAAAHTISRSETGRTTAFRYGSPESRQLRNRTNYIAPGLFGKGRLISEWSVGFFANILYITSWLWWASLAAAVIVTSELLLPQLATINDPSENLPPFVSWVPVAPVATYALVLGVVIALIVGALRAFEWPNSSGRALRVVKSVLQHEGLKRFSADRTVVGRLRELLVYALLLLVLVMIAIPSALWLADTLKDLVFNNTFLAVTAGTAGALGWAAATAWSLISKNPTRVAAVIAGLIVPVGLLAGFIAFGWWIVTLDGWDRVVVSAIAIVVIVVTWFVPVGGTSMHNFYARRLAWAFVANGTGEELAQTGTNAVSKLGGRLASLEADRPELLVCAAGNVGPTPVTPPGRSALPYTFSPSTSGLDDEGSGRPWDTPTSDLDLALRFDPTNPDRTMAVMSAVAISGAAVSPSMGKLTRPLYRALLAVLNVRLGVWLPNPLIRHVWFKSPSSTVPPNTRVVSRPFTKPPRHGRHFVFEALGLHPPAGDFMYVTDGAHYDDLGLLKLLRKRCRTIICLDASGEDMDEFGTISRAMRLAEADLDTQIEIDIESALPSESACGPDSGEGSVDGSDPGAHTNSTMQAPVPFVMGSIKYPDRNWSGTLYYCKATIDCSAPWSVKGYRKRDRSFPNTSTSQQLFNDERFEAYRELGNHIAEQVLKAMPPRRVSS